MKHYLVNLGHGVRRNVIARTTFDAIRCALTTLTLAEQMLVTVDGIHIKAEPVSKVAA